MMHNPFQGMPRHEIERLVDRGRTFYLSRDSLQGMLAQFPRVAEVVDSMAARIGESKAVATAHAALMYQNGSSMYYSLCAMTGAPVEVAMSGAHTILDFAIYQAGIDPQELFAIMAAFAKDGPEAIAKVMEGGK